jgi:spermidine dehydrogenase
VGDRITRRDFLDGVALAVVAGLSPAKMFAGPRSSASAGAASYPPALTGWRGSTPAAYESAHGLRDGRRYALSDQAVEEKYDLVVVGAGICGLAAAYLYRKERPAARVLVLENHDEFGGHARRNEFTVDGRLLVSYGGSESIQSPKSEWSAEARALLGELKVDVDRFERAFDRSLYPGLGLARGVFFTREAFGTDKLVRGDPMRMICDDIPRERLNGRPLAEFIRDFPLTGPQRAKLLALYTEKRDVLAGRTLEWKEAALGKISYREFVKRYWSLDDACANTFQFRSNDYFGRGIDSVAAGEAIAAGYPGGQGLGFSTEDLASPEMDDPYIYHFPDGNASLARLLVRRLIPGIAPGDSMDDIVTARFDYSKLDQATAPVRLRLGSTVVSLGNRADGKEGRVDLGYVREGRLHRVQASRAIYAGYGAMLPYISSEVSAAQKAALAAQVRAPLVYVKVAVRNWQPWVKRGVHEITNPMGFFSRVKLDYPVNLGNYRCSSRPDEPIVLHLVHVPTAPVGSGLDQRAASRVARAQLHAMTFDDFEEHVRDELTRMLGAGGFDARTDIRAITVNRWGHGYAYSPNSLYESGSTGQRSDTAKAAIGRISIAGSDSAWEAYAHAAIDEAARAVNEAMTTL